MSSNELTSDALASRASLRLAQALLAAERALLEHLSEALAERGHRAGVSPAALGFLGQLDCGETSAAEIARRLGVTRQMVSKTAREMEKAGLLALAPDPERRNRKVIRFTPAGERVMADARAALAALDARFARYGGLAAIAELTTRLEDLTARLAQAPAEREAPRLAVPPARGI